jgi:hypothetical protein
VNWLSALYKPTAPLNKQMVASAMARGIQLISQIGNG